YAFAPDTHRRAVGAQHRRRRAGGGGPVRDREMDRFEARHPDLDQVVAAWCAEHPDGSLEDALRDLELWHSPKDKDAQWLVWRHLPEDAPQKAVSPHQVPR